MRSSKYLFLKNLQNSQKSTCARMSLLIKLEGTALPMYLKTDSDSDVFL